MVLSGHSLGSIFQHQHGAEQNASNSSPPQQPFAVPQYGNPVQFNPMIAFALAALFTAFFFMGSICVYVKRSCAMARRRHATIPTLPLPLLGLPSAAPFQVGLDPDTIDSLPVLPFSSEKCSMQGKLPVECSVCLTEFQSGEPIKFLPGCSHFFHIQCIDMWLFSHSTCPICRSVLVPIRCCCSDHRPDGDPSRCPEVSITIPNEHDQTIQHSPSDHQQEKPSSGLIRSKSGPSPMVSDGSDRRGNDPNGRTLRRAVSSSVDCEAL